MLPGTCLTLNKVILFLKTDFSCHVNEPRNRSSMHGSKNLEVGETPRKPHFPLDAGNSLCSHKVTGYINKFQQCYLFFQGAEKPSLMIHSQFFLCEKVGLSIIQVYHQPIG